MKPPDGTAEAVPLQSVAPHKYFSILYRCTMAVAFRGSSHDFFAQTQPHASRCTGGCDILRSIVYLSRLSVRYAIQCR